MQKPGEQQHTGRGKAYEFRIVVSFLFYASLMLHSQGNRESFSFGSPYIQQDPCQKS